MSTQARTRSRELRKAQARVIEQRRAARRIRLFVAGGGLIIVALVVAIVVSLVNAGKGDSPAATPSARLVTPANVTAGGAITIGKATAPVRLEVYVDYMCPYCGRFERANSDELSRLTADGTVRLELYPLSFLDRMSSGTKYSTRAANAIATVADQAPDKVLAFNRALYDRQPAEGSAGLSDEEIASLALGAGIPQSVVNTFPERIFEPWLTASTAAVFQTGVTGTPTVKINGKLFKGDLYTTGPLTQAVMAAKGQ